MRAWSEARPTRALPVLAHRQTFQFESVVDRNDAVDFPVWMLYSVNMSNDELYLVMLTL